MFSVTEMRDFTLFSTPHVVTLLIFFTTCFLFVNYRKKLKQHQAIIKWSLFTILLVCEISIQLYLIIVKEWEVSDLPFQVCSLSTLLALFLCLKKSQKMFNLFFFIGSLPPVLSMISPDIVHQFPHFRFIRYFLRHSAIPLAVLYFILFEGYRVPRKAILSSFLTINIIAVPIFFLNQLLGTNFFFLAGPSESTTILSLFGSGITYYIILEALALIVCIITYIPMGILLNKEKKKLSVD
ncbi:TIGR02206 family membrane protein [Neobacillus pocheonensis]|uniref:YwaF family protein n=1 Tax=Neobacillus pocheonensis TaxID=363869 RepID=UPI003D2C081B